MEYKYTRTINTFNDLFEIYEDARDNKSLMKTNIMFVESDDHLVQDLYFKEENNDVYVYYNLIDKTMEQWRDDAVRNRMPFHIVDFYARHIVTSCYVTLETFYEELKCYFGETFEVRSNAEWFSFESYAKED